MAIANDDLAKLILSEQSPQEKLAALDRGTPNMATQGPAMPEIAPSAEPALVAGGGAPPPGMRQWAQEAQLRERAQAAQPSAPMAHSRREDIDTPGSAGWWDQRRIVKELPEEGGQAPGAPGGAPRAVFKGQAGAQQGRPAGRWVTTGTDTFQPMGRTTRGAQPLDPEAEAAMQSVEEDSLDAAEKIIEAETSARNRALIAAAHAEEDKEAARQEYVAMLERRKAALRQKEDNFAALADQVANTEIDAQRFWNDQTMPQKIIGALSIGLGAAGEALTGARNPALQILQDRIKADISAQKANAAMQKDRLAAEGTLLRAAQDNYTSEVAQDAAALEMAYAAADAQVERMKESFQSPVLKAKAEAIQKGLEQEILQNRALRQREARGEVILQERFSPRQTRFVGGGGLSSGIGKQEAAQLARNERIVMVNGRPRLAVSKTEAESARAALEAYSQMRSQMEEAEKANQEFGSGLGIGGAAATAKAAHRRLAGSIAKFRTLTGNTTESDEEEGKELAPDPTSWSQSSFDAAMAATKREAEQRLQRKLSRAFGEQKTPPRSLK